MRNPKFFVTIIFLVSFFLLILDLPNGITIGNFHSDPFRLLFGKARQDTGYKLGLDLQGGTKLTYKVDMKNIPKADQDKAFEGARSIIDKRINFFGVGEPSIQTLKTGGESRVVIELPGLSNVDQAVNLIGKTAELSFWEQGPNTKPSTKVATSSAGLPLGLNILIGNDPVKTKLTGRDLKNSQVVFSNQGSQAPEVQLNFTAAGTKLFGQITSRNVGKPLAIVLDDQVIEAPRVNQAILTGSAVITGSYTVQTAKQLAIQLNSGALPAPLELLGQSTVGPSLGIESLKKSLFAGLLGFVSVIIFMSYLYKKEGIIASLALVIYTVITLFIFKAIPITLTLAGIAGFILSIGMAVDANILIFERMREELRAGRNKNDAVRLGFSRAWTSIRDSNISSLITAFILYYFGSGIVRGFALTLAIGILVSMFSAIVVTRNLLKAFDQGKENFHP